MKKSLLVISIILAQISLGDFDARIQYRQPRYQRAGAHHGPHQVRQRVSKRVVAEEPQRRTFVSALLMAEIEFLEGLVADQQREAAKKPKQRPHSHNQIQHHQVKYQRPHPHPVRKPPKKYVSKLDPFKMMDAPDLTKEAPKSAEYKAPVTEGPATSTVKYGELEHYNLKGYLPPLPSGYQPQHLPPVTSQPPPYAPPPPPPPAQYNEPAPAPSYHQPPVQAPAYEAPVKAPAYEAPAKAPAYEAPAKAPAYEAPVKAPAYEAPVKAPAYKVVVQAPKYEAPAVAPAYEANPHPHTFFHEAQAEKVHDGEWPTVYYNTFQGNQKTLIL